MIVKLLNETIWSHKLKRRLLRFIRVKCQNATLLEISCHGSFDIIRLLGHCIVTWYAMFRSLVKLTEMETSWVVARQRPSS